MLGQACGESQKQKEKCPDKAYWEKYVLIYKGYSSITITRIQWGGFVMSCHLEEKILKDLDLG